MDNNKYCLIGHHLSLELLYKNRPEYIGKPLEEIKRNLVRLPSEKVTDLTGVKSIYNSITIEGIGISINLLPEQFFELESEVVITKIIEALELAKQLGAQIAVLGSATSIVGNQGTIVAKRMRDISITTGNSYTAACVIDAIQQLAERTMIKLEDSNITIIGATGSIGSVCSHFFAEKGKELTLIARNKNRLKQLVDELTQIDKARITYGGEEQIRDSVIEADIVITATSAPFALLDASDFKPFSLVCDVAVPHNVSFNSGRQREDVLIFEGGVVKPPGKLNKTSFDIGYPEGTAPACLCEGMILAFEGKHENFSIGKGLSVKKVQEIGRLGELHGFKLESFRSLGSILTSERLDKFILRKGGKT